MSQNLDQLPPISALFPQSGPPFTHLLDALCFDEKKEHAPQLELSANPMLANVHGQTRHLPETRAPHAGNVERGRVGEFELAELWRGLLNGRFFAAVALNLDDRSLLVVEERTRANRRVSRRDAKIMELVLTAEQPKVIAARFKLSESSVSCICSDVLSAISRERLPTRAALIVVMSAHAACGLPVPPAKIEAVSHDGPPRWVLSVEHPARALRTYLTPSEFEVVRLTLEGNCYVEMARARQASTRTVANQLASAYRKLRLSGRAALRARSVQEQCARRVARTAVGRLESAHA